MSLVKRLSFGFAKPVPLILQAEAAECGLACLAMVASYHGRQVDLSTLRRRFQISLKGTTLAAVGTIAEKLGFNTRAVRVELDQIPLLKLPCILHWRFAHFVVLVASGPRSFEVHDPAAGKRRFSLQEMSEAFTGVALEIWPNAVFQEVDERRVVSLRQLLGKISGLKAALLRVLAFGLVLEMFAILTPFFLQWVLDHVLPDEDRGLLATLGLGFAAVMVLQQAIAAARGWYVMYVGAAIAVQWKANVFGHLLKLPIEFFERRHIGDIVSRFGSLDQIQQTITTTFVTSIVDGIMTLATVAVILLYSPALSAVPLVAMLIYIGGRALWYGPLRRATEDQLVHGAKQQSHFLESIRGARAIKLFGRERERTAAWLDLVVEQTNAGLRSQKLQLLYSILNGVLFGAEGITVIWVGADLVFAGDFTVGMLVAFLSYQAQFGSRVSSLVDEYYQLKILQVQADRLADIVMTAPERSSSSENSHVQDASAVDPSIVLKDVRYRYSDGEPFVINGISLEIKSGESVAITGPSGCGKSTLLQLVLGALPVAEGSIEVGGINIERLGRDQIGQLMATVMQEDMLFSGSIADNICFFDETPEEGWIVECSRLAYISEEIEAMPMGYQTLVGYGGSALSGGQKQRVLLARALYRRPKILLLDEATSHLDLKRESLVGEALRNLLVTRVVVAHRPNTIRMAGRQIRIESGRVTHDSIQRAEGDMENAVTWTA